MLAIIRSPDTTPVGLLIVSEVVAVVLVVAVPRCAIEPDADARLTCQDMGAPDDTVVVGFVAMSDAEKVFSATVVKPIDPKAMELLTVSEQDAPVPVPAPDSEPLVIVKSAAVSVVQSRVSPPLVAFTVRLMVGLVVGEVVDEVHVIVGAVLSRMTERDVAVPVLPTESDWVATKA